MGGLSVLFGTRLLQQLYKQEPADLPVVLAFSLHSADPGDTGANELSGASSLSYVRAELDSDPDDLTNVNYTSVTEAGSTRSIRNNVEIAWPRATSNWNSGNPIPYWGMWTAVSGGNLVLTGTFSGTIPTILNGHTLVCAALGMTCTVD